MFISRTKLITMHFRKEQGQWPSVLPDEVDWGVVVIHLWFWSVCSNGVGCFGVTQIQNIFCLLFSSELIGSMPCFELWLSRLWHCCQHDSHRRTRLFYCALEKHRWCVGGKQKWEVIVGPICKSHSPPRVSTKWSWRVSWWKSVETEYLVLHHPGKKHCIVIHRASDQPSSPNPRKNIVPFDIHHPYGVRSTLVGSETITDWE